MALVKDKEDDLLSVEPLGLEVVLDSLGSGKDDLVFFIQFFPLF